MAEVGNMPLPKKILAQGMIGLAFLLLLLLFFIFSQRVRWVSCSRSTWPGITDMVRISDARMSGTAYGTVVLHTAPEAAVGGPLALVQDGDIIELDVERRLLQLHVSDEVSMVHLVFMLGFKTPFGGSLSTDHSRAATRGKESQVEAPGLPR